MAKEEEEEGRWMEKDRKTRKDGVRKGDRKDQNKNKEKSENHCFFRMNTGIISDQKLESDREKGKYR